jgi:Zn finger protein HypA/HybF involved in hydrogenase expression
MHELSLALEICRIAETTVGSAGAADIVEVGVEVGDQAGVEPGSLQFCLEVLLSQPPFTHATPCLVFSRGEALRVTYLEVNDGRPDD